MPDTIIAGGRSLAVDMSDFEEELTALESRASLESLESLHQQRRQLLPEYAKLAALHGIGGKWDARRKQYLEAAKIRCRAEASASNSKVTEAYVDALAHADEGYGRLVDEGIASATRYFELRTLMDEIEEKIKNRELSMLAYNAETRLAR